MSADQAIEAFARGHHRDVVPAVAVYCGDVGVAEDAVQEALVRAWTRLERGDEIRSLRAWVATVAVNATRSRFRGVRRERLGDVGDRAGIDGAAPLDLDLLAAVGALPHRQRLSVTLVYLVDLSVADAAEAMGVAEGTVKTALSRARGSLATALGEDRKEARR